MCSWSGASLVQVWCTNNILKSIHSQIENSTACAAILLTDDLHDLPKATWQDAEKSNDIYLPIILAGLCDLPKAC